MVLRSSYSVKSKLLLYPVGQFLVDVHDSPRPPPSRERMQNFPHPHYQCSNRYIETRGGENAVQRRERNERKGYS